jgi:hypothetical protein
MSDWVQWSEIIRNIGLVVGGFIGLFIVARLGSQQSGHGIA